MPRMQRGGKIIQNVISDYVQTSNAAISGDLTVSGDITNTNALVISNFAVVQTISDDTITDIEFNNIVSTAGENPPTFDDATDTVTINKAGTYLITFTGTYEAGTINTLRKIILRNDNKNLFPGYGVIEDASTLCDVSVIKVENLFVDNVISARAYQDSGGPLNLDNSRLSIVELYS